MGTPVLPPRSPGAACVHCDEQGCSAGVTPADIETTWCSLVNCPLVGDVPPDGPYILLQDPIDPCKFTYDGPDFFLGVEMLGGSTKAYATGPAPGFAPNYFLGWGLNDCAESVDNSYLACVGGVGSFGGSVAIDYT